MFLSPDCFHCRLTASALFTTLKNYPDLHLLRMINQARRDVLITNPMMTDLAKHVTICFMLIGIKIFESHNTSSLLRKASLSEQRKQNDLL